MHDGPIGASTGTPRIDLHCHSHYSDGTLSPTALAELAVQRGVQVLALTDHDSTLGCGEAATACRTRGVAFLPGVELTCGWGGHEIHVIGLKVDPQSPALGAHCEVVQGLRRARIERIAARLGRAGLPGEALAAEALRSPCPTRLHLARALCARGWAGSVEEAFERYLSQSANAGAETAWPALRTVVQHIAGSGGVAVLAHPHRYRLPGTQLTELVGQFKAAGGEGLEVGVAGMSSAGIAAAARLARRFDLAGSLGSDFHEPGLPWRPLGCFAKLPAAVKPIMARLDGGATAQDGRSGLDGGTKRPGPPGTVPDVARGQTGR